MNWKTVGSVPPNELGDARQQLHWAVQLAGSVGRSLVAPVKDDSHTSAEWHGPKSFLEGHPTRTNPAVRVGLRLSSLELTIADARDLSLLAILPLDGRNLDEAFGWLERQLGKRSSSPPRLERPTYDLPCHPVGKGGHFMLGDGAAFAELERWFSNAARVLGDVYQETEAASAVRIWPHHFDMATLVRLDPVPGVRNPRSVNIGFSPGDSSYEEPYWYVSPWPHPSSSDLPHLTESGHWHTESFVAAILTASEMELRNADDQENKVRSFIGSAIGASLAALQQGSGRLSADM